MASFGEPDDSLFELHRQSLLDIVEDRNRALNKMERELQDDSGSTVDTAVDVALLKSKQKAIDHEKSLFEHKMERITHGEMRKALVHRVVIISKMSNCDFNEIGESYEKFFKDAANRLQCEPATGLLLLYPNHCVHVVECSQDLLIELIKDLRNDELSGEGKMEKSKIVVISHDIPMRLYQNWNYRNLDVQAHNLDDYDPSEESFRLVVDLLIQILKLGAYLNKQPKVALKNVMENLLDKVPELLPQQDVINYLIENDKEATVTPQEHLDKYSKPFDVTLDSELTWPMPVRLFPYN